MYRSSYMVSSCLLHKRYRGLFTYTYVPLTLDTVALLCTLGIAVFLIKRCYFCLFYNVTSNLCPLRTRLGYNDTALISKHFRFISSLVMGFLVPFKFLWFFAPHAIFWMSVAVYDLGLFIWPLVLRLTESFIFPFPIPSEMQNLFISIANNSWSFASVHLHNGILNVHRFFASRRNDIRFHAWLRACSSVVFVLRCYNCVTLLLSTVFFF
jgi:hypothetical protein